MKSRILDTHVRPLPFTSQPLPLAVAATRRLLIGRAHVRMYDREVPLVALLAVLLVVLLASIALMPLAILQRYRVGTARRAARGWLVTLNLLGVALTATLFVIGAAVTSVWVSDALTYTAIGLATGSALGVLGLALTRWERAAHSLYYTPNKWLVLSITLVVTARVLYGFWRGWHTWRAGVSGTLLLETAGVAESLAAGAIVLGYYLAFWIGLRLRLKRNG